MSYIELTFILAANKLAMELYKESKETLMKSDSYDFKVFKFSKWDEVQEELQEWEDYITIDESTYNLLYSNLCKKFRVRIKYTEDGHTEIKMLKDYSFN